MDHLEVVRTYLDLWNSRTFAEHAHTVLNPNAVLRTGTGMEFQGLDNYVAASLGLLGWMPDAYVELADHQVNGDKANITLNFTGTFTGEMTTPDDKVIPGTGKRAEWQSFVALDFEDGKIARWETTVDMEDFMSQLGLS
jgi:predicted ester cyclase